MYHLNKYSDRTDFMNNKSSLVEPWVAVTYDDEKIYYSKNLGGYGFGEIVTYMNHQCLCVIPSNFLPDKKARFMVIDIKDSDITGGSWFNPPSDSNNVGAVNVLTLSNYTMLPYIYNGTPNNFNNWLDANNANTINNTITTVDIGTVSSSAMSLPSDRRDNTNFSVGQTINEFVNPANSSSHRVNPNDVATAWNTGTNYFIPSPYYNTTINVPTVDDVVEFNNGIYNYPGTVLSHFDGLGDTKKILTLYQTTPAYSNYDCAAQRLNNALNNGTTNMDNVKFYLPSIGELGFIMVRFNLINSLITNSNYRLSTSGYYWSSTQYNDAKCYYLNTSGATIRTNNKYNTFYRMRAFVQL